MVQAYEADALAMADQAAGAAQASGDTSVKDIPCAVCSTPMRVTRVHEVDVDVCAQHGSWFDAHELKKVSSAMALSRQQQFQRTRPGPADRQSGLDSGQTGATDGNAAFAAGAIAAGWSPDVAEVGGEVLSVAFQIVGGIFVGLLELDF